MTEQHTIELTIGGNTKRSRFKPLAVSVDWNALPDNAQAFVIAYGLRQYLADGMAGAESEAEAHNGATDRLAKLKSGDLSRARGTPSDKPDTVETRAMKLAREFIRTKLKAANKTAEKEKIAEAAKKLVDTQDKWKAMAKEQLDAEAKAKAALADDETADLLADLLAEDPKESEEDGEAETEE